MSIFRRWIKRTFSHKTIIRKRPRRVRLRLEQLEDRVVPSTLYVELAGHYTDVANPGNPQPGDTVTWNPGTGNSFTAGGPVPGLTFGTNAFTDLASAVAAANPAGGDTIDMAQGVYTLSAGIAIDRGVTIDGAQYGVDPRPSVSSPRAPQSANEAVIDGNNSTTFSPITIESSNVTIDGLEIRNTSYGNGGLIDTDSSPSNYTNVVVQNDILDTTNGAKAVRFKAMPGGIIQNNYVFSITGNSGLEAGATSATLDSRGSQILNNDLTNCNTGSNPLIYAYSTFGSNISVTIEGNNISASTSNSALIGVGAKKTTSDSNVAGGSVLNNVLSGNSTNDGIAVYTSDTIVEGNDVSANKYGIEVYNASNSITIQNNSVYNNTQYGVYVGDVGVPTNVTINDNSIVNNTTANLYVNYGAAVLDASANWWGSTTVSTIASGFIGATGFTVAADLDFTPILNSGTDTAPATPGFQPDLSSLTVLPSTISAEAGVSGRIQEGLSLATATGTVDVAAGTYAEAVSGGPGRTLVALGTVSMGDGSPSGFDVAANLNVNNQLVTLSDSAGSAITGTVNLGSTGGTLTDANGVTIDSGGTLAGTGTVSGPLSIGIGGNLSPGTGGPGAINTAALTLNSDSAFDVDINGTTPGTGYDQVIADGPVTLGGTLNVSLGGFTPANGSSYTIISNTSGSAVNGQFADLSEGSTFIVGSTTFQISYAGGAGHDVVLTVFVPSPPSTPVLDPGSDSGVAGDDITNVTTPTFTGTAQAGTTVTIVDTFNAVATTLGTATLVGANWSFTVPGAEALAQGVHSIVAEDSNSLDSAPLVLTILTTVAAPSAPVLTAQTDFPRINTPTFTGAAPAGSTVRIYDNGSTLLGTATLIGTNYIFTVPSGTPLANGVNHITARATDVAGNVSSPSSATSVTINTANTAPLTFYVDANPLITTDQGAPGLDYGDQVTWAAGTSGQITGLTYGVTAFNDLQPAINAAQNGDTIVVARGDYIESTTIVVNKSLTILGPEANVDPRTAAGLRSDPALAAQEAIFEGTTGTLLEVAASNVTINGFDFRNAGQLIATDGVNAENNVDIEFNIVHDAGLTNPSKGIGLNDAPSALVQYNLVYNIPTDTGIQLGAGSANGIIQDNEVHDIGQDQTTNPAIYAFSTTGAAINVTIQDNLVYNDYGDDAVKVGAKGGQDGAVAGGSIVGNIIYNVVQDGITVNASNTVVDDNDISGSSSSNGAIYVEYGQTGITIDNNSIHNNSASTAAILIGIGNTSDVARTNVVVAQNSIVDNSVNTLLYRDIPGGTGTVNASENWWGASDWATVSGSVLYSVGGVATPISATVGVDFTPWLNDGTDTQPATTGFQPDLLSLTVAPATGPNAAPLQLGGVGRIQEGINDAASGGTVDVLGGTYNESPNVNANVNVVAQGALTINGSLTIGTGSFTAPSTTLSLSGNFADSDGGFVADGGTVILDGVGQTISGNTTFASLNKTVTAADTLTFAAGSTQTVTGTLTLLGASGNLLALRSTSPGTRWNIDPQGAYDISYIDLEDSDNTSATPINPLAVDSGDNTNWILISSVAIGSPSVPSTASGPVTFSVTALDAYFNPTTISTGDFALDATGTASGSLLLTGSGNNWVMTISNITGNGTLGITLTAHSIANTIGATNFYPVVSSTFTVNNSTSAYVVSIVATTPAALTTNAKSLTWTVTFSEPVTGVTAGSFVTATTGSFAATTITVTPVSGSVYTVTVNGVTGNGTMGLNLVDNNSIHDLAGHPLTTPNAPAAFQAQQTFATGSQPRSTALGDLNRDGKTDLVVANFGGNSVSVLLGNGNGAFQAQKTYAVGSSPRAVVIGDVNGDGIPDIVVADSGSASVSVLLGNGNGTFQAQKTFSVSASSAASPRSIVLGDVNGDGKLDLIVGDFGAASVSVLLGNGNGTFQAAQTFAVGADPYSVATGDVNGDGKLDIISANQGGNSVSVLLGNGTGAFQAQQTFAAGAEPRSVAVGNLNGDGKPDLAVANYSGNSVSVLLGNGNGTFQAQKTFAVEAGPISVAIGDVTGDSNLDLVVANFKSSNVSVLVGNGNGAFQAQQTFAVGASPSAVAPADVNGDNRLDLVSANVACNDVSVLVNARNGNFTGQVYTVDQTPPTVTITTHPSASTTSTSATFSFTGSDPKVGGVSSGIAYYQYQLDNGGWITVTNPVVNFSGLATGNHTFEVRAVDNAGNIGNAVSYSWDIETSKGGCG